MLSREDIALLEEITTENQFRMPEVELSNKYFFTCMESDPTASFWSSSEIRSYIERMSGIRISQQKLSIALKKEGFINRVVKVDGKAKRGFYVKLKKDNYQANNETNVDDLPF